MMVLLVRLAMTMETPIELPRLRISVHMAVPCVRKATGTVESAIMFSGTNINPSPKPCSMLTHTIVRVAVSGVKSME